MANKPLRDLIAQREAEANALAMTHTNSDPGQASGTMGRDLKNYAGGVVSGILGLPGDIASMLPEPADMPQVNLWDITSSYKPQDPANTLLATTAPSLFSDLEPQEPKYVPFTTEWFGEQLGVDPTSGEFFIGSLGSPDPRDIPAVLGTLAGVRGAGRLGRHRLDKAKEIINRARAGGNNDAIRAAQIDAWRETGWFYDRADGAWKWEIPDDGASIRWDQLKKRGYRGTVRVGDILDHPQLFEAYPELKDIQFKFNVFEDTDFGVPSEANFSPKKNLITLEGERGDVLSTLIHELNHAVQDMENFGPGGNASTFPFTEGRSLKQGMAEFERQATLAGRRLAALESWDVYVSVGRQLDEGDDMLQFIEALQKKGIPEPDFSLASEVLQAMQSGGPGSIDQLEALIPVKQEFARLRMSFFERVQQDMQASGSLSDSANIARSAWAREYRRLTGETNARLAQHRLAAAMEYSARDAYYKSNHPLLVREAMMERDGDSSLRNFNVTYFDDSASLQYWTEQRKAAVEDMNNLLQEMREYNATVGPTE